MEKIFKEIESEIHRSELKHGIQFHIPSLDQILLKRKGGCSPERMAEEYEIPTANRAKFKTDSANEKKELTQAHIVIEELCEVVECMNNEVDMRKELIQLACTVIKWIKTLDHNNENLHNS